MRRVLYLLVLVLLGRISLSAQAISSQWYIANSGQTSPFGALDCDKPSNVAVSGGELTLTARNETVQCGDAVHALSTYNYTTGLLWANTFNFTYGIVHFRAKLPGGAGTGAWPAIYLLGASTCQTITKTDTTWGSPCYTGNASYLEIDMAEGNGSATTNLLYVTHVGGDQTVNGYSVSDITQYHEYEVNWSAGHAILSVDGTQLIDVTTNVPSGAMYPAIWSGIGGTGGSVPNPASFPTTMTLDYFRICPTAVGAGNCTEANASIFDDEFSGTGPLADVYVSQTPQGNVTGLDCANSFGIMNGSQVNWINDPGYWTNGQIGPGTTIHLCGNITTRPEAYGSGTSGSHILFQYEVGANGPCPDINGESYIDFTGCQKTHSLQGSITLSGSAVFQ